MHGEGSLEEAVKFTGKELDPETGLYYFNARWYDPVLGRFTTEDPARDGVNWFVYVGHNPLRFIDPTGLQGIAEDSTADKLADHVPEDFSGTIITGNFVTVSAVAKYSYFAGTADEYSSGQRIETYQIKTHSFGAELNAGIEVGKTLSVNTNETKKDILGKSITSELSVNIPGGLGLSYGANTTANPTHELSGSIGYSALPVSPSIEFNSTQESTYDYNTSVKSLHTQSELDGWIETDKK